MEVWEGRVETAVWGIWGHQVEMAGAAIADHPVEEQAESAAELEHMVPFQDRKNIFHQAHT
jgi:hypothetical protein